MKRPHASGHNSLMVGYLACPVFEHHVTRGFGRLGGGGPCRWVSRRGEARPNPSWTRMGMCPRIR